MKKEIGCGTEDNDKFIQADEKIIASQTKQKEQKNESNQKKASVKNSEKSQK